MGCRRSMRVVTGGIGYLRPVAQLNSTARSSFETSPRRAPCCRRRGRRTLRAQMDAIGPAISHAGRLHLAVLDGDGEAIALAQHAQDQEIADGAGHAQAGHVRVAVLPRRGGLTCPARRRARSARRSRDCTATMRGRFVPIQPMRFHLREGLPHADEAGAAAGRIEDHVGQLPAELLGELQAHRLLALDAVGLLQGRDVNQPIGLLAVLDDGAAVGDEAVDEDKRCAPCRAIS